MKIHIPAWQLPEPDTGPLVWWQYEPKYVNKPACNSWAKDVPRVDKIQDITCKLCLRAARLGL